MTITWLSIAGMSELTCHLNITNLFLEHLKCLQIRAGLLNLVQNVLNSVNKTKYINRYQLLHKVKIVLGLISAANTWSVLFTF